MSRAALASSPGPGHRQDPRAALPPDADGGPRLRRRAGPDHPRAHHLGLEPGPARFPQRDRHRPSGSTRTRSGRSRRRSAAASAPSSASTLRISSSARSRGRLNRPVKWIEMPQRELPRHQPRPQPDRRVRGRRRQRRHAAQALKGRVILDSGAYPKALDLAWGTWVMSTGPYIIPNLDYMVEGVYTNTMANGAYRGAGRPEATFYLERLMDLVADEGGLDAGPGSPQELHPAGPVPVHHPHRRALRHRRV